MSIENRITLVKELIRKREEIDQQLAELFGGQTPRKPKCSICGSAEHTARSCPQKTTAEKSSAEKTARLPPSPFDALASFVKNDQGGGDSLS